MENLRNIYREEIEEHRTLKSCWLVIHGKVYDITGYLHKHPAGVVDLKLIKKSSKVDQTYKIHI